MNMVHFYRMIKSIKKKDNTLTLFIKEDDPLKLYIQINQNGENDNKGITGHINITLVRPIIHEQPTGYGDPIIVKSKEFQKIKQLNKTSKTMDITCSGRVIDLFCNKENVYSKRVSLGEDDDEDEEREVQKDEEYKQTFDSDQILDLVKTASTSNTVQIYINNELPLHFKMNVGALGSADVYIKSRETIEEEDDDSTNNTENVIIEI